jgi:hypothetical protein
MPSEISRTIKAYQLALDESRGRYERLYALRGNNALEFYQKYANRLVRQYAKLFQQTSYRRRVHRNIGRLVGTERLDFVAVDGSCNKDMFTDFIVFSACAYGAKGQLELDDSADRPAIRYRRWELERDVSMVAYVPVPFAQLADAVGEKEDFLLSDQERMNLASVHTKLMQLAEIYLAYNVVTSSSIERPRLVLMDLLPSSVMASVAASPTAVNLGGYEYDRRRLDFKDIVVALAHPFCDALALPNRNEFRLHQLILGELHRTGQRAVNLRDLAARSGVELADLLCAAARAPIYGDEGRYAEIPEGLLDKKLSPPIRIRRAHRLGVLTGESFCTEFTTPSGARVSLDVRQSWEFCVALFRSVCDRLFRRKEPGAMIYRVVDIDGQTREHWLDPNDIDFLIGVGLRALVEACWEQNVVLLGIAKDSASRYFTRNYLGVLRYGLQLPELSGLEVGRLPWTDRMFFEFVASLVEDLESPWATCEFDSAFMTLWMGASRDASGNETQRLGAVQDHIVAHMGLFGRSLAQFFLSRRKKAPLMGHVIFVDRLLTPETDRNGPRLDLASLTLEQRGLAPHRLGAIGPLGYTDAGQENLGQDVAMYLLSSLTRNHYPEVIGYPDPLHKADWGAKTLADRLRATIRSSEAAFAARPLSKTFRTIRDSYGRC